LLSVSGKDWSGLGSGFRRCFRSRDEFPGVLFAQQAGDKLGVHGVSGAFCNHVAEQRVAEQGNVPNQVEKLVPAKLVREA